MDVRFVYSLILIISMMFLCLMIPPDSKQKSQEKENITRMDLKSQLIINLLYPKIIAKILNGMPPSINIGSAIAIITIALIILTFIKTHPNSLIISRIL